MPLSNEAMRWFVQPDFGELASAVVLIGAQRAWAYKFGHGFLLDGKMPHQGLTLGDQVARGSLSATAAPVCATRLAGGLRSHCWH